MTVIAAASPRKGRPHWLCACDCGAETTPSQSNMTAGFTRSCGCIKREQTVARNTTHGLSRKFPKMYRSWKDLRARCNSPNNTEYPNYGGRGIRVCDRWDHFPNFLEDMGERPEGLTIDRIDTNGHYQPDNCRWADAETQATNQRRIVMIEHDGISRTVAQWSRHYGVGRQTAKYRLKIGKTFEEAFSQHDFRR